MNSRTALTQAVLQGLLRPPCVVSFSGGRDSSAVLALATDVARREGLPPPLPVSLRFPGIEGADESSWQELVVRHLGLEDWERVSLGELDFVGPVATTVLRRHGLLWPPNTYFHELILQRAAGGALLTGIDGDGLFEGRRWIPPPPDAPRRQWLLQRGQHAVMTAAGRLPTEVRSFVVRRRWTPSTWVRPEAWPEICRDLMSAWEPEPLRWDERLGWWSRRRYLACIRWSLERLADVHQVHVVHPLADAAFLTALAREGGAVGVGDRMQAMRYLFSDLLPDEVLCRDSKAYFDRAVWARHSRHFIHSWDGQGVDAALVDPELLRAEWMKPLPLFTAAGLLQSAWLNTRSPESVA
jgi:asparagine synthase (glutamine-hydrolysing)